MSKYFLYSILCAILGFCACSKHAAPPIVFDQMTCEKFLAVYVKKTPCEKLDFVMKERPRPLSCYQFIGADMYKLTGVSSSMTVGRIGVYYESDSLFEIDIKTWRKSLGCQNH